jgi:hypothetical protein
MTHSARLTHIRACSRFALADPPIVGTESGSTEYARIDDVCPVHKSADCVDRYVSETELGRMSLLELWHYWRATRRGRESDG